MDEDHRRVRSFIRSVADTIGSWSVGDYHWVIGAVFALVAFAPLETGKPKDRLIAATSAFLGFCALRWLCLVYLTNRIYRLPYVLLIQAKALHDSNDASGLQRFIHHHLNLRSAHNVGEYVMKRSGKQFESRIRQAR
jgi:hypothetical protein